MGSWIPLATMGAILGLMLCALARQLSARSMATGDCRTASGLEIGGIALLVVASLLAIGGHGSDVRGAPRMLQLGATYDVVPSDKMYALLKGPDGKERVYEIDDKLIPSVDRWLLPKLMQRFKYEEYKKLLIVIEDLPKSAAPDKEPDHK